MHVPQELTARPRRAWIAAAGFALALGSGACSGGDDRQADDARETVAIDLLADAPWALLERDTREIRFGTAAAEEHVDAPDPRLHDEASGFLSFGANVENAEGAPLAVAVGRRVRVRFTALVPGERHVVLDATGLDDGQGAQPVAVYLNEHVAPDAEPVARFALPEPPHDEAAGRHAFTLPAERVLDGENALTFAFGRVDRRAFPQSGEPFRWPVAAAFRRLAFERTDGSADAGARRRPARDLAVEAVAPPGSREGEAARDALVVEEGCRASFALRLPEDAPRLRLAAYAHPADAARTAESGARLVVSIRPDGRERTILLDAPLEPGPARDVDLDLAAFAGEIVSLSFAANGGASAPPRRLALLAPRVECTSSFPVACFPRTIIGPVGPESRSHVVVFTLDAAGAQHVGRPILDDQRGAGPSATPVIDRLAREGITFARATSPASYTLPSVASLFTGLAPDHHGLVDVTRKLPADAPTLAEAFAAKGYDTLALVTNPNAGAAYGLDRGFATYDELFRDSSLWNEGVPADALAPRLAGRLDALGYGPGGTHPPDAAVKPLFLYVHVFQPHAPYAPPERFLPDGSGAAAGSRADGSRECLDAFRHHRTDRYTPAELARLAALYRANLAYADAGVGAVLDLLDERGILDEAAVLVVGDHGEAFGEHVSLEHSETVFGEEVEIPFVLKLPHGFTIERAPGSRLDVPVTLADVLPTFSELFDLDGPANVDGVSVAWHLCNDTPREPEERDFVLRSAGVQPRFGVRALGFTLHADVRTRGLALFDLAADPGETRDLRFTRPVLAEYLRLRLARRLAEWTAARAATDADETFDAAHEEAIRQAQQIGYAAPAGGANVAPALPPLMRRH